MRRSNSAANSGPVHVTACTPLVIEFDRVLGEHPARHVAVPHRHAVHEAREVQREVRHVQHPLVHAAAAFEQRDALVAEHVAHHVERELVVPRRHRRVRREDAPVAHRLEVGVVELEVLPAVELPLEQLQRQQRRVPFIEMVDRLRRRTPSPGAAPRRPCPSTISWQRR